MKVFIIRHGTTELNKRKKVNAQIDEPLIEESILEAQNAIQLIPKSIKKIYSSPLIRAKKTANIIGEGLHIPVLVQNELTEINMGILAGKSWEEMGSGAELKQKHRTVQFDYRSYGGESLNEVKKRLLAFIKKIQIKHADNEVLIVTHGGIIRILRLLESGESIYETEKHVSPVLLDIGKILTAPGNLF